MDEKIITGISNEASSVLQGDSNQIVTALAVQRALNTVPQMIVTAIDSLGQQYIEYDAVGGETSIVIPFQIDTSRPIAFQRNGLTQSLGIGKLVRLSGTTFIIQSTPAQAGEYFQIYLYRL